MSARDFWVFGKLAGALSDRLEDPLDPRVPGAREIKDQLRHLRQLMDEGKRDEARWQETRLQVFLADWDRVAAAMPDFATELRGRFIRDEQLGGYIGARAELALAALFLEKGVSLERVQPEGPDFTVQRPDGRVVIESTTTHLTTARESNFYKIEQAIRDKGKKDYCGPDAILYVDYTSIAFRGGDALNESLMPRTQAVVNETRWGAVLTGALMVVAAEGTDGMQGYLNALLRFDGRAQSPALRALLDSTLPHAMNYPPGLMSIPATS